MSIKVIAIGNRLMGNDAVGIRVLEMIENVLNTKGIVTIVCETDIDYCLSFINDGDYVFIIDASIIEKKLGEITVMPIDNYKIRNNACTQHQYSLYDMLQIYKKNVKGYIIAIEVDEVVFGFSLSIKLENMLGDISLNILNLIMCQIYENSEHKDIM